MRAVWTLALNSQLTVPPTYDDLRGFFPIENDRIAAYELASGKQLWIAAGRPVLAAASVDELLILPEAEAIVALHAADGRQAWRAPQADSLAVPPTPAPGFIVISAKSGTVSALRVMDGSAVWSRGLGSPARAAPTIRADRIYVPLSDGRVVALVADTGEVAWERKIGGAPGDVLALEERVFVGSTDNFFYCLMASDGRIDWRWRTGADVVGIPAADASTVYFASLDNVLRALNQKSGGQRWMRALPVRPASGPLVVGATVVVSGRAPTIRTFNTRDGSPATDIAAGDDVIAPPRVWAQPGTGLPAILVVTRNIERGDSVAFSVRSIEPLPTPIAPLPNPTTLAPTLSTPR